MCPYLRRGERKEEEVCIGPGVRGSFGREEKGISEDVHRSSADVHRSMRLSMRLK